MKKTIPIFFAIDDKYIPFFATTLQSLADNSTDKYEYVIRILYTDVCKENKEKIKKYERDNIKIEFVNVNCDIDKIKNKLHTRDYFTNTTYFRILIPKLYPKIDKALYIDSDVIINTDIAELFNIDIEDNLLGAAKDDVIINIKCFAEYVEKVVGMASYKEYFNAGILIMNLSELRKAKLQEKFLYMLDTITFKVAQDQDYLNRICKGRVKMIDSTWNKMPITPDDYSEENINIYHYNLTYKPWHFDNVPFEKYFWKYAKKTEFYNEILEIKNNYTEEEIKSDIEKNEQLQMLAQKEADCVGDDRKNG